MQTLKPTHKTRTHVKQQRILLNERHRSILQRLHTAVMRIHQPLHHVPHPQPPCPTVQCDAVQERRERRREKRRKTIMIRFCAKKRSLKASNGGF